MLPCSGTLANCKVYTKGRTEIKSRRPAFSGTSSGEKHMADTPCNWMVLLVWPDCEKANYYWHPQANYLFVNLCLVFLLLMAFNLLSLLLYSVMGHSCHRRALLEQWWELVKSCLVRPSKKHRQEPPRPGTIWGSGQGDTAPEVNGKVDSTSLIPKINKLLPWIFFFFKAENSGLGSRVECPLALVWESGTSLCRVTMISVLVKLFWGDKYITPGVSSSLTANLSYSTKDSPASVPVLFCPLCWERSTIGLHVQIWGRRRGVEQERSCEACE